MKLSQKAYRSPEGEEPTEPTTPTTPTPGNGTSPGAGSPKPPRPNTED